MTMDVLKYTKTQPMVHERMDERTMENLQQLFVAPASLDNGSCQTGDLTEFVGRHGNTARGPLYGGAPRLEGLLETEGLIRVGIRPNLVVS